MLAIRPPTSAPTSHDLRPTIPRSVIPTNDPCEPDLAAFCSAVRSLASAAQRALHGSPHDRTQVGAQIDALEMQLQRLRQVHRLHFAEVGRWLDRLRCVIEAPAT